jgi:hypothetical protein
VLSAVMPKGCKAGVSITLDTTLGIVRLFLYPHHCLIPIIVTSSAKAAVVEVESHGALKAKTRQRGGWIVGVVQTTGGGRQVQTANPANLNSHSDAINKPIAPLPYGIICRKDPFKISDLRASEFFLKSYLHILFQYLYDICNTTSA